MSKNETRMNAGNKSIPDSPKQKVNADRPNSIAPRSIVTDVCPAKTNQSLCFAVNLVTTRYIAHPDEIAIKYIALLLKKLTTFHAIIAESKVEKIIKKYRYFTLKVGVELSEFEPL